MYTKGSNQTGTMCLLIICPGFFVWPAGLIASRSEIEAGETALEGMESGVADAQTKCKEAEARLKITEEALAEKDGMIKYVEEEVERVKGELVNQYLCEQAG